MDTNSHLSPTGGQGALSITGPNRTEAEVRLAAKNALVSHGVATDPDRRPDRVARVCRYSLPICGSVRLRSMWNRKRAAKRWAACTNLP